MTEEVSSKIAAKLKVQPTAAVRSNSCQQRSGSSLKLENAETTILKTVPPFGEVNFAEALVNIQTPLKMSPKMARETDDSQKFQIKLLDFHHWLRMHFVYKERWNSKHKIPVRLIKEVREAYILDAKHTVAVVELSIQCHSQEPTPYAHGAEWIARIEVEAKNLELDLILSNTEGKGKQAVVDRNRLLVKELSNYENPIDSTVQPHLHKLIEIAQETAQANDVWRRKFWSPFIKTNRALLRDIERNPAWQQVYGSGDGVYVSTGPGLHCQNLLSQTIAM